MPSDQARGPRSCGADVADAGGRAHEEVGGREEEAVAAVLEDLDHLHLAVGPARTTRRTAEAPPSGRALWRTTIGSATVAPAGTSIRIGSVSSAWRSQAIEWADSAARRAPRGRRRRRGGPRLAQVAVLHGGGRRRRRRTAPGPARRSGCTSRRRPPCWASRTTPAGPRPTAPVRQPTRPRQGGDAVDGEGAHGTSCGGWGDVAAYGWRGGVPKVAAR